jgi:hypothetical protein
MEYRVEDLPRHGVILLPPSSPEFTPLLADSSAALQTPFQDRHRA